MKNAGSFDAATLVDAAASGWLFVQATELGFTATKPHGSIPATVKQSFAKQVLGQGPDNRIRVELVKPATTTQIQCIPDRYMSLGTAGVLPS